MASKLDYLISLFGLRTGGNFFFQCWSNAGAAIGDPIRAMENRGLTLGFRHLGERNFGFSSGVMWRLDVVRLRSPCG